MSDRAELALRDKEFLLNEIERLTAEVVEDHALLVASAVEIERLRHNSMRLTADVSWWENQYGLVQVDNERLRSERLAFATESEERKAENERLTAALQLSQSQNYCTLCGALEPKP